MLRRRAGQATPTIGAEQPGGLPDAGPETSARPGMTPPKGAPTPKRSEAQARRRQPYQAPADRKSAAQRSRQRSREERIRRSQALQRGEQWALPPKDRGPVRALARDVVDARRGIGEYYMLTIFALVVLLVLPFAATKFAADALVVLILLVMLVEGGLVSSRVKRMAQQRYPGESTKGLRLYVVMRGISMRRMRIPKPRVNRGDPV